LLVVVVGEAGVEDKGNEGDALLDLVASAFCFLISTLKAVACSGVAFKKYSVTARLEAWVRRSLTISPSSIPRKTAPLMESS
jgi:hypothetical protein